MTAKQVVKMDPVSGEKYVEGAEKALVGAVGVVFTVGGELLSTGFLHGTAEHIVTVVVGIAGAVLTRLAVYQTTNSRKPH